MNMKKMEISCQCGKKYKNRAFFEKHQYKCQSEPAPPNELLDMIQTLSKRVAFLEKQMRELSNDFETPEETFQECLRKVKTYVIQDVSWDRKANEILLDILRDATSDTDSIKRVKKTFVYDEETGWIKIRDLSPTCIESAARLLQTKLLVKLGENMNENYFKNISKITSIDIKKWIKENISKL